jgi:hypothetical protein
MVVQFRDSRSGQLAKNINQSLQVILFFERLTTSPCYYFVNLAFRQPLKIGINLLDLTYPFY